MSFRANTSFTMLDKESPNRNRRMVREGDIVADDDKAVKKYPHLFESLEVHMRAVEEASANPGVKRDLDVVIRAAPGKGKK